MTIVWPPLDAGPQRHEATQALRRLGAFPEIEPHDEDDDGNRGHLQKKSVFGDDE